MNILRPSIYAIAMTSLALSSANAQTTATTDPVGFTTVTIKGKGALPAAYSLAQFAMMKASSFQGSATPGASQAVLNVTGTPFTAGAFNKSADGPNYFLEISSGTSAGLIADIESNTDSTVTVYADDAASIAAAMPATVTIRAHTKVSEVFGTGASLVLQGGSTVNNADLIYFGRGGQLAGYFYKTGVGAGWKTLAGAAANNIPVYPGESVLVKRIGAADVSIVNSGSVQTGRALIPVSQGSVTAATSFPVATTLSTSNLLASGLTGGATSATADILYMPDATGNLVSYFYKTGVGAGFKFVAGGANANAVPISEVGGVLITRRSATPFNWIVDQPYANN
jgi:uncharacterized protein (TIGR02597 family)